MLLTGRRLLRQLSLKLPRKWLKLKLQKRPRKRLFLKNKKKTRRSMMKLSQLKLLHSKLLKNKQKKHKRQLLQLEKHKMKGRLLLKRNLWLSEKLDLTNCTHILGHKVLLVYRNSNLSSLKRAKEMFSLPNYLKNDLLRMLRSLKIQLREVMLRMVN